MQALLAPPPPAALAQQRCATGLLDWFRTAEWPVLELAAGHLGLPCARQRAGLLHCRTGWAVQGSPVARWGARWEAR